MKADGRIENYNALNAGGYTLEALMNIKPNGRAEPDFEGWELKTFATDRITLLTPEPDLGYYGKNGVEAFVRKYGHKTKHDTLYFTGTHKANVFNEKTELTLLTIGYKDNAKGLYDPSGGLALVNEKDEIAAMWSYAKLLEHWAKKHANAAYIKNEKKTGKNCLLYKFNNPVWLGEGTDFIKFINSVSAGRVFYDPGQKVTDASTKHSHVKARSQFRISFKNLSKLYIKFDKYTV